MNIVGKYATGRASVDQDTHYIYSILQKSFADSVFSYRVSSRTCSVL